MKDEQIKELLNELGRRVTEPVRPGLGEEIKQRIPHRLSRHKIGWDTVNIIIAIILNMIFVYAVLKSSTKIERFIGKAGINVIRKIFGVILLAIAVKLFASNVQVLFK